MPAVTRARKAVIGTLSINQIKSKAGISKRNPTSKPKPKPKPTVTATKMASRSVTAPTDNSPIYFWKPHEQDGYLGQWYPSPFTLEGIRYETAEMWMMVQKAKLFNDEEVAAQMAATTDPKAHKALGRKVKDFKEQVWDDNKSRIVEEGNYHKFTIAENAEELKKWFLATGESELVEASALDRIWGVGFSQKNAAANRAKWGRNLLGIALMNTRRKLRQEIEGSGE